MLMIERQQRLIEVLREQGTANLEFLAKQLDVSVSTVRRDLDSLATRRLVERTHGGAIIIDPAAAITKGPATAFEARMATETEAKRAIGAEVARMIEPNMTLLMDAGSTIVYAARQITVRPIQIVTTSLAIATHFADDDQAEVTVVGGELYPRTAAMVGPLARQALSGLYADLCLFSAAALDETAAYNINVELTRIEQVMIEQADRTLLLMDAGKFGRRSLVRIAELDRFEKIITNDALDPTWIERLGDRLCVAPP